MKDLDTVR